MLVSDAVGVGLCHLPVVLSSGSRRHRDQLAHGSEDTEVTNPHDDETVDDTGCATVVETLGEENQDCFPGDQDSAAKAKNRQETKVALRVCQSSAAIALDMASPR